MHDAEKGTYSLPALSQFKSLKARGLANLMYVIQERRATDFEPPKL